MSNLSDMAHVRARVGTGWGFAIILLGILALMTPFASGMAITTLLAVLVVAAGLSMTVYAFKAGSFGKGLLQFLFGGITIVCGVAMFATPMMSMLTLTGVLMGYFIVDGVFSIVSGVQLKPQSGWGWVVVSGVASIVLAVLLWRQWPASGAYAIGMLLGIRLIFTGWSIAMLGMFGDAAMDSIDDAVASVDNAQRPG